MKRKDLTYLLLALGMLVLAACSTSDPDGDGPPLPDRTVLNPAGETTAAHSGNLTVGETDYFELNPNSLTGDLIVVELNENLLLQETTTTGGIILSSSTSAAYFTAGDFPPAGINTLEPTAIGPEPPLCRGSCIVLLANDATETLYFQVSGAVEPTDYAIFVYGANHVDTNEPSNDEEDTAPGYFLDDSVEAEDGGAIETIGDVDWWRVAGVESEVTPVEFIATGELELELYLVREDVVSGPFRNGQVVEMLPGDLLRVESASFRASRGANSFYYFSPVMPPAG